MNNIVTRRLTWKDTVPFPGNPIYERRLEAMLRNGPGYNPAIVGSPALADNAQDVIPGFAPRTLFVIDGNHRRALAEREGKLDAEILADLYRGLSLAEMHRIRRGLNDRRTVKPSEVFMQRAEENRLGPERHIRDLVEGLGWHISYDREDEGMPCTNELMWIHEQGHDSAVIRAIQTYEDAWGRRYDGATQHSQARVVKGLGAFWVRYPDAERERVAKALAGVTVDALYVSGRQAKETLTWIKTAHDGIRFSVAQSYNRIAKRGRLEV